MCNDMYPSELASVKQQNMYFDEFRYGFWGYWMDSADQVMG